MSAAKAVTQSAPAPEQKAIESKFLKQFKAARRVATPLIFVRTPDPAATINLIVPLANGETPLVTWDIISGMRGIGQNDKGRQAIGGILGDKPPESLCNPVAALRAATRLPVKTILFFHNAHMWLKDPQVVQAVWNLRDIYKGGPQTLVMLGPLGTTLPPEIAQDVLVIDEPLPSINELQNIIQRVYSDFGVPQPSEDILAKASDAVCGLAAFPTEQVVSMSLSKTGADLDDLRERKRKTIEQTEGLSVWRGGETFDAIGGCDNAKKFLQQVIAGDQSPRAVVFIDEVEKSMAGATGDTSGVSQEMLGTLLSYMQDKEATGVIFVGPPGAAKSAIAKATGNTAGIPTIAFDLSGMKGSLVGQSGSNLRAALNVVEAVSQGRTLFIATCNSIGVLPPELRRRFNFGTFFFDLPDADERKVIWQIYLKKYDLHSKPYDGDDNWTGAEIKQCCDLAHRLKCSLKDAAAYIVPVSRSAADQIEKLRQAASGKFISASYPGIYKHDDQPTRTSGRKAQLPEEE